MHSQQGKAKAVSFTMTPHGVHAYIPFEKVGDKYILVDIACQRIHTTPRESHDSLYLLLHLDSRVEHPGRYPHYHCQVGISKSRREYARRLVKISAPILPTEFTRWKDIYISPRPHPRSHLNSDLHELLARLMVSSSPPFRIKPNVLSTLRGADIHLMSVTQASTPWTGHPPVELTFRGSYGMISVTLGVCRPNDDAETVNHSKVHDSHYVLVRSSHDGKPFESSRSITPINHNCSRDHVSDESTRSCPLSVSGDRKLKVSFTRSLMDSAGETLEVHMEVKVS